MNRDLLLSFLVVLFVCCSFATPASGSDDHRHGSQDQEIEAPKVYLDKSPRAVAYQLKRLDNARLLLVECSDDDPKYLPVHLAIFEAIRHGSAKPRERDQSDC